MNEVQRCKVERVIREVLDKNRDKPLNEIKRMVKDAIRIKKRNQKENQENMKLVSEINSEMIVKVLAESENARKQKQIECVKDTGRISYKYRENR